MSVNEAKAKFEEAKKDVERCQHSIRELQAKCAELEESQPKLSQSVEEAEQAKVAALDCFALSSNKQTESALKAARQAHETAQRAYNEGNELAEATNRALKRQESELVRLNNACELAKRQCWESIADEIRSRIPEGVISDIQRLVVASMQCSRTKQFVLSELLPNLNPSEYQTRRDELIEKYDIE